MDEYILKVLEHLEGFKYKHNGDISPIINEIFPYPKENPHELKVVRNRIQSFLDGMLQNHMIMFDRQQLNTLGYDNGWDMKERWMGEYAFLASIDLDGLKMLYEKRRSETQLLVHQSVISTNESVQKTNQVIAAATDRQNTINQIIATNSGVQATASTRQTAIFRWTALFALCTMIITGISLYRDFRRDQLNQVVSQKDSLIRQLQQKLLVPKTDTSLHSKAKKIP